MSVFRAGAALGIAVLILVGCSNSQQAQPFVVTPETATGPATNFAPPGSNGYPSPSSSTESSSSYPAPATVASPPASQEDPAGRSQTALQSYALALKTAQENYSPQANLRGIIPSRAMIRNIGSPPVLAGWFYMFRAPDQGGDYFVQIVNEEVSGTKEMIPLELERPLQMPITIAEVKIDSDKVLEIFRENAPAKEIAFQEGQIYDLELVLLEGQSQPVWSVVSPDDGHWLYSINAVTGEEAGNPRG